jgi:hypothetical protein
MKPDELAFDLTMTELTRKEAIWPSEEVEYFRLALEMEDRSYIWDWLKQHYPDYMKHIHKNFKNDFIEGALHAWQRFQQLGE